MKVTLKKPDMDVLVDTSTISRQIIAEQISKSISFDNVPGPISLRIINRIWGMLPFLSSQITGGAIQYLLAVGKNTNIL